VNVVPRALGACLLPAIALLSTTASAALPAGWTESDIQAWTSTASSCAIDEAANTKHEFVGSQFRFRAGEASSSISTPGQLIFIPITARCNVTPIYAFDPAAAPAWRSPNWNALVVGYADPDGPGRAASVTVRLKRLSRATLSEATVVEFNSNNFPDTAPTESAAIFGEPLDFARNEYYMEINLLRRPDSEKTPVAYSVRLTNGVGGPN
jgi:hypothetical protein